MVAGAGSDFFPILVHLVKHNKRTMHCFCIAPWSFGRFRISLFALQGGFEDNSEKLEEGEFAHMQKQGGTCMHHVRNISAGVCEILPGVQD